MYRSQEIIEEVRAAEYHLKSAREFLDHIANDQGWGFHANRRPLVDNLAMVVS